MYVSTIIVFDLQTVRFATTTKMEEGGKSYIQAKRLNGLCMVYQSVGRIYDIGSPLPD